MNGLKTSLNALREISSEIYHQYIPTIDSDTDISAIATPVLKFPEVYNEFCNVLVNKLVYTQFMNKSFNNPFTVLEGDRIPLGYAGEELYINPVKGRQYNAEDFAGLLFKYEADVKVQYTTINYDRQYPVTFSRQQLKKAFTSWNNLETFIDQLSNSLYNGCYIDEYNAVRQLVAGAYKGNSIIIETVNPITSKTRAEEFTTKMRNYFLDFQVPSNEFNAWHKVGGKGRPITTWTNPEDIVLIVRNDIRSYLDVNVLANAFNINKATLLGNMLSVKDFDIYNENGTKNFDGSKILAFIGDKSWFRIKEQDKFMDSFYNPNNRSIQYYLNNIKMYQMSLFANGVILATEQPTTTIQELSYEGTTSIQIDEGDTEGLDIVVKPFSANSPTITYETSNNQVFTVVADENNDRHCTVTAVGEGTATLTAKAGNVQVQITVNVVAVA